VISLMEATGWARMSKRLRSYWIQSQVMEGQLRAYVRPEVPI
jgi:hypothetical protein